MNTYPADKIPPTAEEERTKRRVGGNEECAVGVGRERLTHVVELEWLDDRLDFFHNPS